MLRNEPRRGLMPLLYNDTKTKKLKILIQRYTAGALRPKRINQDLTQAFGGEVGDLESQKSRATIDAALLG